MMVRAHLELTAPKYPPVLVTLLTPDGLVQASFSPTFSSLSFSLHHIGGGHMCRLPLMPAFHSISETETDPEEPKFYAAAAGLRGLLSRLP